MSKVAAVPPPKAPKSPDFEWLVELCIFEPVIGVGAAGRKPPGGCLG